MRIYNASGVVISSDILGEFTANAIFPLTGWAYRKSITLSRASGAVTNYQMKLLVGKDSGATGENVDCAGHCENDFKDIRFTKADGITLLDYCIESSGASGTSYLATIWIEFDSIGTGNTTFYMYYGNSGATGASDIQSTFIFGDDFSGALLDTTNRWNEDGSGGSVAISSGEAILTGARRFITSKSTYANNNALHARVKFSTSKASFKMLGYIGTVGSVDEKLMTMGLRFYHGDTYFTAESGNGTSIHKPSLGVAFDTASYHIMELRRYAISGTNYDRFILDGRAAVTGNYSTATARYIDIDMDDAGQTLTVDWIFLRQYLSTEPAWGSWGSEEGAVPITPIRIK